MFSLLFARTFIIVGVMLLITAGTARINKAFETAKEMWLTIISTFAILIAVMVFADSYPINLVLVAAFSAVMGWEIGPTIEYYGKRFKQRKFIKNQGISLKKGESLTEEKRAEFENIINSDPHANEWHNIVFQALLGTALAVLSTAGMVFLTNINFGFLGGFLFIALVILIVMSLLNGFFFHSPLFAMVRAYLGVVIFTLYLLFDFDRLEKMAGDQSWGAAIDIAINIYLDIINLFLELLQILAESSD